jgi:hypothetical protein
MLLQLFQNSLISLGQQERIIINTKIFWRIWIRIRKCSALCGSSFLSRGLVIWCLNACMTWSQKLDYFWKWRGNIFLGFVITTGCVILRSAHTSTREWTEHKPTKSESFYQWSVWQQHLRGSFDCGKCNCDQTIWSPPQPEKGTAHWCQRISGRN